MYQAFQRFYHLLKKKKNSAKNLNAKDEAVKNLFMLSVRISSYECTREVLESTKDA